jgi:hypothetical protein
MNRPIIPNKQRQRDEKRLEEFPEALAAVTAADHRTRNTFYTLAIATAFLLTMSGLNGVTGPISAYEGQELKLALSSYDTLQHNPHAALTQQQKRAIKAWEITDSYSRADAQAQLDKMYAEKYAIGVVSLPGVGTDVHVWDLWPWMSLPALLLALLLLANLDRQRDCLKEIQKLGPLSPSQKRSVLYVHTLFQPDRPVFNGILALGRMALTLAYPVYSFGFAAGMYFASEMVASKFPLIDQAGRTPSLVGMGCSALAVILTLFSWGRLQGIEKELRKLTVPD